MNPNWVIIGFFFDQNDGSSSIGSWRMNNMAGAKQNLPSCNLW